MKLPIKLILCITVCLGLGFLSGYYAGSADTEWYRTLTKPSFQPPPWLFGPVWTVLYVMIGVSVALIWDDKTASSGQRSTALMLFLFQFVLNLIWSPVFFTMHALTGALIITVNLIFMIVLTMRAFGKINKTAQYLLLPYLFWVCFATVLNGAIVYLN
jgi:tryptophan-rich sensory protein